MDILAHGLWTNIVFRTIPQARDRKVLWWGIVFGVLPDLVSFTPVFAYLLFGLLSGFAHAWDDSYILNSAFGRYAETSYNYTHSFVIWAIAFILVWMIFRKLPVVLFGWSLHIAIDLFTHPNFYQTPFLFPISDYRNPYGISWGEPVFMIINYSALFILYLYLVPKWRKKLSNQQQ